MYSLLKVRIYKHLTREQKYAIYLRKTKGETLEMIAQFIGVNKSHSSLAIDHWRLSRTIFREKYLLTRYFVVLLSALWRK